MRRIHIPFLILSVLLMLGSCSQQSQPTGPATGSAPGQIPPDYAAVIQQYQQGDYLYDLEQPETPLTMEPADSTWDVYMITVVWGSFSTDLTGDHSPVDWSGMMMAYGEFDNLVPISFEPGEDTLVPPNPPVQRFEWKSFTSNDIDGIQALLFVDPNNVTTVVKELTFETTPVSFRYTVDELAHLRAFYPAGMGGVAIQAFKIPRTDCPHGRLYGRWVRDTLDDFHGRFGGLWVNQLGCPFGAFKGTFGIDDGGQGVFQGEILNYRGEAIGKMSGEWAYTDLAMCPTCGTRFGAFEGRFVMDNGRSGTLGGQFGNSVDFIAARSLRLRGHWEMDCPTVAAIPH